MKRPLLVAFSAIGFALSLAASPAATAQPTDLIPRNIFFGNPDRAAVQVSPDGTRLSYLAPSQGVMNVWVQTIGQEDARVVTRSTERPIRTYFWAHNAEQIIYAQDRGGDENFNLFAVNLATGEEQNLTPFENIQARVTATDRNFPDDILVGINNRNPALHDVWRINTRTGERELIHQNDAGFAGFIADSDFAIRVALRLNQFGGLDAYIRDSADADWYELAKWNMIDAANSGPAGFTRDGRTLYVTDSRDADTSRLYAYTVDENGRISYNLIAHNDLADLSGVITDPDTGRVQAVSFEYARTEWTVLDESIRDDWNFLSTVTDGDMNITSRDHADNRWVVAYIRDNGPVEYYLYDRSRRQARYLFTNRAELEGLRLSRMEPVIIEARDGLNLVSYLTLPAGMENQRRLPMVLLVHGGPWARDSWGLNGVHQWLANRGYAVLSVNFRGSTGFGKEFLAAGNREWAGKMHDDLIDAVNWAIERGTADPDRVAIMGGSYGGYATLVGLTFTPEVFAAGVDIVGPSNVRTLLESIPPYWEPVKAMFETRVGSLDEPDYLDSISPLTHVDRIQRPLLIGQGANDPRVKVQESEQIVDAMQERDIPVTYVVFPDEGHGFARPVNSLAFWAITEAFLATHLGGRLEPLTDEVDRSTAQIPAGKELIPALAPPPPPAPPADGDDDDDPDDDTGDDSGDDSDG